MPRSHIGLASGQRALLCVCLGADRVPGVRCLGHSAQLCHTGDLGTSANSPNLSQPHLGTWKGPRALRLTWGEAALGSGPQRQDIPREVGWPPLREHQGGALARPGEARRALRRGSQDSRPELVENRPALSWMPRRQAVRGLQTDPSFSSSPGPGTRGRRGSPATSSRVCICVDGENKFLPRVCELQTPFATPTPQGPSPEGRGLPQTPAATTTREPSLAQGLDQPQL